jgi:hypothetical protein
MDVQVHCGQVGARNGGAGVRHAAMLPPAPVVAQAARAAPATNQTTKKNKINN